MLVIIVTIVISVLLLVPLSAMAPSETASDNPTGNEVVQLSDHVEDTFEWEVYWNHFIVEAEEDGDMLTQEHLHSLYLREQALRESEALSPFLYTWYIEELGIVAQGVYSIADYVDYLLPLYFGPTVDLSNASDDQVKEVVEGLISDEATAELRENLSVKADLDTWTSPAINLGVLADEQRVEEEYGAHVGEGHSGDISLEHYGRATQEVLRGEDTGYEAWGVAMDIELEIEDEGQIAFMLVVVAMILIAIILLIIFRSWMIATVTVLGLIMLIIWMKGFSNLIGLESSMVLDLIVPISIVVLGVDYAIQALFRYREERDKGERPDIALGTSTYRIGPALVLAMLTTVIAFGANASSDIESVVGFAIAASFAIFASLILLGFFVPTVVMRYQRWRQPSVKLSAGDAGAPSRGTWLGRLTSEVSDRWYLALLLIVVVTVFAAWGWTKVETRMDVKDAFDSKSDLVVSLDKLDEHIGEMGGEPALIYIEGDLTQHEALEAMRATIEAMKDDESVAKIDGEPNAEALLLDILEAVVEEDYAKAQIASETGVTITDDDEDGLPDTSEQLQAVYDFVTVNGVGHDETTVRHRPERIQEVFLHEQKDIEQQATLLWIGVPGTREQENVRASSLELNEDLDTTLSDVDSIDRYGLTGEAYVRLVQFDAIADALTSSLIIAIVAVLLLLLVVFRSFRYAVMTLIPVLLVACWLYGFMYVAGYYLNMMTATIAAISIGVGIDFSIHFTERFRQELPKCPDKKSALREASRTTGFALFCTALTTAVGFFVIAFAPMPMFATFGLLTAIMITLSLLMALFALPSLLLLFAPKPPAGGGQGAALE
jgi:predicted RND superfamily exporter protein